MKTRDPDDLLKDINRSIMFKGLVIAFTIHAVLILGTSFGLYREWGTYGFLATPSTINNEKQKAKRAEEEAARQAAIKQRAEDAAAAQAAAAASGATKAPATPTPPQGNAPSDSSPDTKEPAETPPLPPKRTFDLDDIGGI